VTSVLNVHFELWHRVGLRSIQWREIVMAEPRGQRERELRVALGNLLMEENKRLRKSAEDVLNVLLQTEKRLAEVDAADPLLDSLRACIAAAEALQGNTEDLHGRVLMLHRGPVMWGNNYDARVRG